MLDPQYTAVWDLTNSYRIPLKRGSVAGNVVTIHSRDHWLETGDIVNVLADPGFTAFGAINVPVTKIDKNTFSYTLPSAPSTAFPNPKPGLAIGLWLTCNRYSIPLVNPERIRMNTIPAGTTIQVQTRNDDGTWKNQKVVTNIYGIINFIFTVQFKEARFVRIGGAAVPTTISLNTTALPLNPNPDNTFEIPEFVDTTSTTGGSGNFTLAPNPPSAPNVGDWWLDSDDGILYTYVDDGDTKYWVELNGGSSGNANAGNVTAGTATITGTGPSLIDSISAANFRSAKYQMQISDGVNYEMCTVSVIHNNATVFLTTYGNVWSTSTMGDFDATISGGTVTVTYTSTVSNNKTVKFVRTLISD